MIWLILAFAMVALVAIALIPVFQVRNAANGEKLVELRTEARKVVVQVVGGLFVLLGLYYTAEEFLLSREEQLTTQFSSAVVNLRSEDVSARVGGVYALGRLAESLSEEEKRRLDIVHTLATFVADRSPRMGDTIGCRRVPDPSLSTGHALSDVQAAMTVLGRLEKPAPINLSGVNLRRVIARDGDYRYVDFARSCLFGADFRRANVDSANFEGAILAAGKFDSANAVGATFTGIDHGEFASFVAADLRCATLDGNFGSTDFRNVNATGAQFMLSNPGEASWESATLRGADLGADPSVFEGADTGGAIWKRSDDPTTELRHCFGDR